MAEIAGNAGWLLAIYISVLIFIAFLVIQKLYSRFEGMDLLDISSQIAGGAGRIIVGTIVIVTLLFFVSLYLRIFAEDMKIVALTNSPISYVTFFFVACMTIGAYLGIEAIARYHALVIPIIVVGYLIIIVGVSPYMNVMEIFPILGNGAKPIFIYGSLGISVFMELIYLFLLVPFIKSHKNFKNVGYTALGFSTIFLTLSVFV
jgi:purine-cytosine permease-like protein